MAKDLLSDIPAYKAENFDPCHFFAAKQQHCPALTMSVQDLTKKNWESPKQLMTSLAAYNISYPLSSASASALKRRIKLWLWRAKEKERTKETTIKLDPQEFSRPLDLTASSTTNRTFYSTFWFGWMRNILLFFLLPFLSLFS